MTKMPVCSVSKSMSLLRLNHPALSFKETIECEMTKQYMICSEYVISVETAQKTLNLMILPEV